MLSALQRQMPESQTMTADQKTPPGLQVFLDRIKGVLAQDVIELDLSATPFDDLAPVKALVNLEKLDISKSKVVDISPLETLVQLKELDVSETVITEAGSLARLKNLKKLLSAEAEQNV